MPMMYHPALGESRMCSEWRRAFQALDMAPANR
jgi:hypothetical protein